jgi:hypothetical protein
VIVRGLLGQIRQGRSGISEDPAYYAERSGLSDRAIAYVVESKARVATQKYGLDSLLGVDWESVSTVGFTAQLLRPILQ